MFQRSWRNVPSPAGHGIRPLAATVMETDWSERALQRTWRSVGRLSVLIGLISALVSPLPTMAFGMVGLWAYGKSNPALRERWLHHSRVGRKLCLWAEQRQISRRSKVAAIVGLSTGGALTAAALGSRPLTWGMGAGLAALCLFLATRTEPQSAC